MSEWWRRIRRFRRLRVVCQLCGKTEVLDTESPRRFEWIKIESESLPWNPPLGNELHGITLWICPECESKHTLKDVMKSLGGETSKW